MKREIAKLVLKSLEEIKVDVPPTANPVKVTIEYSFDLKSPEVHGIGIGELLDALLPKCPGRPALLKKFDILDAAAQEKATKGKYRHVAFRFGKSPKQITDLVNTNKPYFVKKVAELSATNKSK